MFLTSSFVAFIAGSFAAVLLVASALDPDLFLHFEITPHRTVLFYLGVFGSILAIARGMIPEDNAVFDPEYLMRELVRYTHYLPPEWKGKLHSQKVGRSCCCNANPPGAPGLWPAVPDEGGDFRARAHRSPLDPVHSVVLAAKLLWRDYRLFPRVYNPRRGAGIRVQLCRI
jgi:hypothetical protein